MRCSSTTARVLGPLALLVLVTGCARETSPAELVTNPSQYDGKTVTVAGSMANSFKAEFGRSVIEPLADPPSARTFVDYIADLEKRKQQTVGTIVVFLDAGDDQVLQVQITREQLKALAESERADPSKARLEATGKFDTKYHAILGASVRHVK